MIDWPLVEIALVAILAGAIVVALHAWLGHSETHVPADPQTLEGLAAIWPTGANDYNVICKGAAVGRVFLSPTAPQDRQWMWIQNRTPAHGYEPMREEEE